MFIDMSVVFLTATSTTSGTISPLVTVLQQSGKKIQPVKGDGNCLFWSFSLHLLGNQDEHFKVRSMIVRFENLNSTHFEPRMMDLINQPTFKDHISKMSQPGCWGTHIEIMAIASIYTYISSNSILCADPPQSSSHKMGSCVPCSPSFKIEVPTDSRG